MSNSKKNQNLISTLIIVCVLFGVLFVIFIGVKKCFIDNVCESSSSTFENIIKAENNKNGLHIENDKNIYTIYYKVPSIKSPTNQVEEFFNIDTGKENFKNLSEDLPSPFFTCNNQQNRINRKIIYVILDISKSVVNDIGNGYEGYFDQVASIIHTTLNKEVLHPEDEIRIRFLGTNKDKVRNIDFTGPQFKYLISKNDVQKKNTLKLLSYSNDPMTKCDNTDSVISVEDLIQKISTEYNQRKLTPDNLTNITELLEKISSEVDLEKDNFKSVSYIVFTDGISDDGYAGCRDNLAEHCGTNLRGLNMNNDTANRAYLIWVKDRGIQETFRRLFNGILINFQ